MTLTSGAGRPESNSPKKRVAKVIGAVITPSAMALLSESDSKATFATGFPTLVTVKAKAALEAKQRLVAVMEAALADHPKGIAEKQSPQLLALGADFIDESTLSPTELEQSRKASEKHDGLIYRAVGEYALALAATLAQMGEALVTQAPARNTHGMLEAFERELYALDKVATTVLRHASVIEEIFKAGSEGRGREYLEKMLREQAQPEMVPEIMAKVDELLAKSKAEGN